MTGTKVLEEVESPINGKITVLKSLAFGTHFQVGGLTQSGGLVYEVWKTALKKVKSQKFQIKSCLILGLGGGSAALLVRRFWPIAEITGVDIDPTMIELGKKYLNLEGTRAGAIEADAAEYCDKEATLLRKSYGGQGKYDLILVDIYVGDESPKHVQTEEFVRNVEALLEEEGIAVFNRLYYGEKRPEAEKFGKKLEKVFSNVSPIYPEANVMFVCSN